MRILLYGGSFDPPHYGHLNNLRAAAARVCPDRVVVMPAGVSPFKQGTSASGPLRVEMCGCFAELAREMGFGLEVSGWEVEQAEQGRKNYQRPHAGKAGPGESPAMSCTSPSAAICC